MSVKVMSWVWEHSRAKGSARLVLLALADHAGADGGDAYPSIRRLQERCNLSERAVQDAIQTLIKIGELQVDRQAGPHGVNRYRVVHTPAESAPPQNLHPRKLPRDTPQNLHPTPAESAPEPSTNHPEPSSPRLQTGSTTLPGDLWTRIAEKQLQAEQSRARKDPIRNTARWKKKAAENAEAEMTSRACELVRDFDLSTTELVEVLVAGSNPPWLNLKRRKDPA